MIDYQWLPRHETTILGHITSSNHKVIAIAGATCSGKTTFASWLSSQLDATVISMDDFYRNIDDQLLPFVDNAPNFDLPDSYKIIELEDSIQRLLAGNDIEVPVYDIPTNMRTAQTRRIAAGGNLYILEGLYAFLVGIPSYKVYTTADRYTRCERRLARDLSLFRGQGISADNIFRHFSRIEKISSEHFTKQAHQADIIINTAAERG